MHGSIVQISNVSLLSLKLLLFSIATLGIGEFSPFTWAKLSQLFRLDEVLVRAGIVSPAP